MRSILACAAAVLLASPALGQAKPAKEQKMAYTSLDLKQGLFRCDVPADWWQSRDEHAESRTKVQGMHLVGDRKSVV